MDLFMSKAIQPMLIAGQTEPYDDVDSIFELKLDGIRCIAYCDANSVDLRNKRDMKLLPCFPELQSLYQGCHAKCILDGELIVMTDGRPNFYEVQKRTLLTDPFKMKTQYSKNPASFVAYDILYYKNHTITDKSLMERKDLLERAIDESNILSISRYIECHGVALFDLAKTQELEGVVGKKKDSLYWLGKRTQEWKKIKWLKDDDFICIAYILKPKNMTSLVLAKYNEKDELIITNHVTLGVSLSKLRNHNLEQDDCPFPMVPPKYECAVWIKPIVCTVEYMPSDKSGLRQAVFKGIRDDKSPNECRLLPG